MNCLLHGDALFERARIGQPDVFHRHTHHAAGNVHAVFTRFQHSSQPVERGIGIAGPDGLVQRGNQVVVFFAGLVVEQNLAAQRIGQSLIFDHAAGAAGRRHFERVVGGTDVAIRGCGDLFQHFSVGGGRFDAGSARRRSSTISSVVRARSM